MPSYKHGGGAPCFLWLLFSGKIRIQLLFCHALMTTKLCPHMSARGCLLKRAQTVHLKRNKRYNSKLEQPDNLSSSQDWTRQEQHDQDMLGLSIWCTGLGGGDPPESGFLHVLSCVPHSPVYGATLARKDDWEKNLTTLGRTAAVHEYFVFAALSSSHGAQTWQRVPGAACCDAKLLAHRAAWVLANAKLIPAHRREPHTS